MVTVLILTIITIGISSTSGFFFRMPTIRIEDQHRDETPTTTAATTTKEPEANKPIHIHHHYKFKYIQVPPTTTESPWTWTSWPSFSHHTEAPEVWQYPKWSVKPVKEPDYEELPESQWKPYWDWQTTTTESPPKWAYRRQIHISNKPTKNVVSKISQKLVTPSLEARKQRPISKRVLIRSTTEPIIDNTVETTIKPEVNTVQNAIEGAQNIVYRYIYKVNSPHTKDIKMHHEESDGSRITGHYSFVEPDGRTRVVYYTAGKDGFKAHVKHYNWGTNGTQNGTS